jgi:hypothetical protein
MAFAEAPKQNFGHSCVPKPSLGTRRKNNLNDTNKQSKDYFFVILSAAKNLLFKSPEILHSAALRSE